MLKINILCVGSVKENFLKEGILEYKKRISKFATLNFIEVKEAKIESFENQSLIKKTLDEEGEKLLKQLNKNDYVILVDLHGEELVSEDFASKLNKIKENGNSTIDFIIGGTLGLSDNLKKIANYRICLSKMTFPHQLTRLILLEQIYRAFKILNNESYHH
jgi:23S rRNA (pseudouridine1915-N3)-methyltransferase